MNRKPPSKPGAKYRPSSTPPRAGAKPKATSPAAPRARSTPPHSAPQDARPAPATDAAAKGDRIAKVLSRAGVASRREAERMVELGRIAVNGKTIDSPALNVTAQDRIEVDGKPLPAAEAPRLWLYHKPSGLVTSNSDEKGRRTIFDALPEDLPRVMTVGRLDLNSEGLLLLTNDGGIKRQLELPSTGWLRRYRVRINGRPQDADFAPLRNGLTIDGERFQPMTVVLDRQQGANAWLTIGLREGKNREIRRAIEDIGFTVNRLLRISYGPFQLGTLKLGEVEELRPRVVRDQLGLTTPEEGDTAAKPTRRTTRPDKSGHKGRRPTDPARKDDGYGGRGQPGRPKGSSTDTRPKKPGAKASAKRGKPGGFGKKPQR